MCRNLVFVISLAALLTQGSASSHDAGAITPQFIRSANAISAAFANRDAILLNPAASASDKSAAESFVYLSFVWEKPNLTVCFWQNKPDDYDMMNAIIDTMNIWGRQSLVTFDGRDENGIRHCADHNSADIRVTLDALPASYYAPTDPVAWDWSRYGRLARDTAPLVSMSLVSARYYYTNGLLLDFHFLVAHETGHALGLIHEHQRVDCVSWLADDAVLLKVWPQWKADDVGIFRQNLALIPTSRSTEAIGPFDANSIMMYNFDQRIWRARKPGEMNPCARPTAVEYPDTADQNGIMKLYGIRPAAAAIPVASVAGGGTAAPPPARPVSPREADSYYAAMTANIRKLIKLRGNGALLASYDNLRIDAIGASKKAGAMAQALTDQFAISPDSKLLIAGTVISGSAIDRLSHQKADLQAKFEDMIRNMDEAIDAASR